MKSIFYKIKILFASITSVILLLFCICGCFKQKPKTLISYSFLNDINNLDPTTAYTSEEITVIGNIFEGLYKKGPNGKYILGMAKNVDVSEDGKSYLFTIRDNVYWRNAKLNKKNVKVTAKDFLFSFRRLLSPNTNAPSASNYFFIKNAKAVKEGKMPIENLGVSLGQHELLLKIDLEYQTPMFKELLAAAPAMPCNEYFFNLTKGRYGTSKENTATNGPFFLNAWNKNENKVRIRANDKYYGSDKIKIVGVNFSVRSKEEAFSLLKSKNINTAILDEKEYNLLNKKMFKSESFQNAVVGIAFNQNNPVFSNDNIKIALAHAVDRQKIKQQLTPSQVIADSLIPSSITIFGKLYNEVKSNDSCLPEYDPVTAKKYLTVGLKELQNVDKTANLNSHSILVQSSCYPILNQILQTWQKDLGVFLKVESVPDDVYYKRLESKDFESVVLTLSSNLDSPYSILNMFTKDSHFNYMGYDIKDFKPNLDSALHQKSASDVVAKYFEAENIICKFGYFIPLYFETEYFVFDNKIEDIIFTPGSKDFYFAYTDAS